MAAPVTFAYASWIARYPEFAAISEATAQEYFNEATIYWRNDGSSPNRSAVSQSLYLNMLTAHIAALYSQSAGSPNPGAPQDANSPVGRTSQATEGSVSVQFDLNMNPTDSGLKAWLQQTKYGLSFWAAAMAYWKMQYRPGNGGPVGFGPFGLNYGFGTPRGGFGQW